MRLRFALPLLSLLVATSLSGCDPLGGSKARLVVRTITTGSNLDPDGYMFKLDDAAPVHLGLNDQQDYTVDASVQHTFVISDVAANCAGDQANGTFSSTIELFPGETRQVLLTLVCVATS